MFDKRKDSNLGGNSPVSEKERPASSAAVAVSMGKTALIGPGIKINGDITGNENLVVEGKVEGTIVLESNQVIVGESGKVHANVTAKHIKIDGELKGDIDGREKVVISKSGNVRGNITAPRVMLEDGALFKGSIDINPAESAVAELPLPATKPAVSPRPHDPQEKESGFTSK
jgi:cytoskeletal protein CcmA (bactofilin family)